MKTLLKIILGILLAIAVVSVGAGLIAMVAGASVSLIGVVISAVFAVLGLAGRMLGFLLRLAFNPIVLILLAAFVLSGKYKGSQHG